MTDLDDVACKKITITTTLRKDSYIKVIKADSVDLGENDVRFRKKKPAF